MAILSDKTLKEYLEYGKIGIEPLDYNDVQPASVDLRLGDEFKVFKVTSKPYIDSKYDISSYMETVKIKEGEPFIIHPNEFALATTSEYIKVPDDLVARVEGRSSMGRLGVTMHVTAGYIDPGFEGKITLEISNIGAMPVALYPGQRVCQIVFETLTTPSETPYGHPDRGSKYMGQTEPECSKITRDSDFNKLKLLQALAGLND